MKMGRAFIRFLVGALAAIFMMGSTVSVLGAVSTRIDAPMSAMPTKSDCSPHGKPQGCAISCVLVCGAIAPTDYHLAHPSQSAAILAGTAGMPNVPYSAGPEPPPPRT